MTSVLRLAEPARSGRGAGVTAAARGRETSARTFAEFPGVKKLHAEAVRDQV